MILERNQIPINQSNYFNVDNRIIRVNSEVIRPNSITPPPNNPIVFFPGWGNDADSRSAQLIGRAFADTSKREVIIIDTKPHDIFDKSLFVESVAVAQFLEREGAESTTLVGYSEGGIKATNLAVVLQEKKVKTDGLILMGSAGLYRRKQSDPVLAFFKHGIQSRKIKTKQYLHDYIDQEAQGIVAGQIRELVRTKLKYPKRLAYQVREISRRNARLKDVNIPVVLINGAEDLVSEPESFLPGFKSLTQHEREEALRRTLFPRSPFVRFLAGNKLPLHTMPVLRAPQVARVSLGLIREANNS